MLAVACAVCGIGAWFVDGPSRIVLATVATIIGGYHIYKTIKERMS